MFACFYRYKRPSQFDAWLTYNIDVLPKTLNCDKQENTELCMNFAGCMHCLWQDGNIRTLRANRLLEGGLQAYAESNGDDVSKQLLAEAYDYYYDSRKRRRLYPKILPDFAGIDDYETDEGFCVEGFGNAACPVDTSSAASVSSPPLNMVYICLMLLFTAHVALRY